MTGHRSTLVRCERCAWHVVAVTPSFGQAMLATHRRTAHPQQRLLAAVTGRRRPGRRGA